LLDLEPATPGRRGRSGRSPRCRRPGRSLNQLDQPIQHVLAVALSATAPLTVFLDAATSLISRMTYDAPGAASRVTVEESYSDYRTVKGLQVAFKAAVRRGGGALIERTLRTFDFNVAIDPALFVRPS